LKRVGGLWPQLVSRENLFEAAKRAAAGKRKRGEVARFWLNLEQEVLQLERELVSGAYQPGRYRSFWIEDPKRRLISAAPFRDRVVHHALTQVLEPVFEVRFHPHAYASRKGKGVHAAIRHAEGAARKYEYVLKCDIRKYFASMDHEILMALLGRSVKCKPTLELARRIVAGSNEQEESIAYFEGDLLWTPYERRHGLPRLRYETMYNCAQKPQGNAESIWRKYEAGARFQQGPARGCSKCSDRQNTGDHSTRR